MDSGKPPFKKENKAGDSVTISPRKSFKAYNIWTALARNVDSIKAILAIITGANFLVGFDWKIFGMSLLAGFIMLVAKLATDAVDYFFKEVEIVK